MTQKSYVYFMTNQRNTVLYVGVTSDLIKRVYQHKTKAYKGFTAKYNCDKLVYFEEFSDINEAIAREKQIKKGNRKRKEILIQKTNTEWKDLSEGWIFDVS
ncbi:GIY-YIG nuclease family protein [Sinomicrobium oceani]|nr:GIY-YIG nuclease family protein [Sinomicrobium oceani]